MTRWSRKFVRILIVIYIYSLLTLRPLDVFFLASKLRKAGVFSRVDDSNTSIGKRYARNDELGTPFGVTLDFACTFTPSPFYKHVLRIVH